MATDRPLARLGIADLEEIFQKQGEDLTILSRLKHELSFRQVPRALALQERIRKAEAGQKKSHEPEVAVIAAKPSVEAPRTSSPPTKQLDLLGAGSKAAEVPKVELPPAPKVTVSIEPQPLPQLALDDACKILRVSIGDVWEKVELARRKTVLKSSPIATKGMSGEQVQKLLSEAKLANDAAIVIAARRSGYQ
jgi:hypothetical protein